MFDTPHANHGVHVGEMLVENNQGNFEDVGVVTNVTGNTYIDYRPLGFIGGTVITFVFLGTIPPSQNNIIHFEREGHSFKVAIHDNNTTTILVTWGRGGTDVFAD